AAGLVLGLQASDAPLAPAAPAAVAISEGTTTVDGVVDLRAGGVQVRVDGRARVTVAPDGPIAALGASADPDATLPEALIVVPGTAGSTPLAEPGREGGPSIGTDGAPAPVAWQASAGRGDGGLARGGPGAASTPGRFVVTVQVERGSAVIGAEGRSVPVAAGESHTFSPSVIVASHPADNDDSVPPFHGEPVPGLDRADEQESVARRAVTLASELARGADGTPEIDGEDQIAVALESVPGAELLDLDCDSRPCLAVFDYTGDDPAWRDALAYAIAEQLSADVVLTEGQVEVEGETLDLVAVAIDNGKEPRVRRTEDDHRARGALAAIARELTE
ncbi:MAG: hypothetical protein Q8P41_15000, partial [Pseudomonadota bacterium]|nr:hypothetical protein [Pseudomonadota bacterium]